MFVRQAPGRGRVQAGVLSYDLYLLLLWLHYAYAMLLMAGINHSAAEHSAAQHNTNINFPSTHNKYSLLLLCCCCCFPRAIFCSVHRSAFPPLLLCPEYFTHLLRLVGCECICLAEGKALLQALFLCLPRAAFPIFPSKMF